MDNFFLTLTGAAVQGYRYIMYSIKNGCNVFCLKIEFDGKSWKQIKMEHIKLINFIFRIQTSIVWKSSCSDIWEGILAHLLPRFGTGTISSVNQSIYWFSKIYICLYHSYWFFFLSLLYLLLPKSFHFRSIFGFCCRSNWLARNWAKVFNIYQKKFAMSYFEMQLLTAFLG